MLLRNREPTVESKNSLDFGTSMSATKKQAEQVEVDDQQGEEVQDENAQAPDEGEEAPPTPSIKPRTTSVKLLPKGAAPSAPPAPKKAPVAKRSLKGGETQEEKRANNKAPPPSIPVERDLNMFYPDTYDKMDEQNMMCDGDPIVSKVGGGKMAFIKYMDKERGISHPLCSQAPKMFLPSGISEFQNATGKVNTNALCSLGKDWESNVEAVSFKNFCDRVKQGCARIIVNKGLHLPYCKTIEDVLANFTDIVFVSEKISEDDPSNVIVFAPSIKLIINTAPNNKTLLVSPTQTPNGTIMAEIDYKSVQKSSSLTPMITFRWIYRKKDKNGWTFSVNCAVHQGIIDPPTSSGIQSNGKLAVVIAAPPSTQ